MYSVEETQIPVGYACRVTGSAAEGFTVTNSYTPETTTITVQKVWKDDKDSAGQRNKVAASMYLRQMVDGVSEELTPVTVGSEDNWSYTWEALPVYDHGSRIEYSVREVLDKSHGYSTDTPNWKSVSNGGSITVTNTLKDSTPGTGDNTKLFLWIALLLISVIGFGSTVLLNTHRKKNHR